ncbi:LOW QUALITY PROTEIN: Histidine--tRNA ligase [Paramyrothecium foliicola]|nr:LOW QUALITY PROTEIN: Histidine--tRNA ligase [Paramyrothecium foliicola]
MRSLLVLPATLVMSRPTGCQAPPYFVLTGDSTTAIGGGWGDGFLSFLQNSADGLNPAKNGATTVSFRKDGRWDIAINAVKNHTENFQPIVTIQFGHNDQKPVHNISLPQYKQNLIDLANEVTAAGGTPILITSLTRRGFSNNKVVENLANERQLTIEAANEVGAKYLDLNRASTDYVNAIGEQSWNYNLEPDDRTHLNDAGRKVFGRMVADLMIKARPDLERYIKPNKALSDKIWAGERTLTSQAGEPLRFNLANEFIIQRFLYEKNDFPRRAEISSGLGYFESILTKMATKESLPSRSNAQIKTPKGTRDWVGPDLLLRDHIFQVAGDTFKRHGGVPLDTPVFELRSVLSEKYGEDQKLIYNLEDQGGELCALRYDLTVPFARWLAMHSYQQVKRYQIAKVYRRDQPAISRGRFREFYQCDFDIAGTYDPMIPDSEIIRVIFEVFRALDLEVIVKVNHRRILDGLFTVAGVPTEKLRPISSAVDKLDKAPWDEVKREMIEEKGLPEAVADRVGEYVRRSGTMEETLEVLKSNPDLVANDEVKAGVADMELLAQYLQAMSVSDIVSFDLSLARGLDYYTGLIYEVIVKPAKGQSIHVGSVAAGGRYNNLEGMYGKRAIPCTPEQEEKERTCGEIDVYVMAAGGKGFDGLLQERMAVASQLWDAGIRAEFQAKVKPKMLQQFNVAEEVPVAVILGDEELAAGQVRLKDARAGDKETIE